VCGVVVCVCVCVCVCVWGAAASALGEVRAGVEGAADVLHQEAQGPQQSQTRGRWLHLDRASLQTPQGLPAASALPSPPRKNAPFHRRGVLAASHRAAYMRRCLSVCSPFAATAAPPLVPLRSSVDTHASAAPVLPLLSERREKNLKKGGDRHLMDTVRCDSWRSKRTWQGGPPPRSTLTLATAVVLC